MMTFSSSALHPIPFTQTILIESKSSLSVARLGGGTRAPGPAPRGFAQREACAALTLHKGKRGLRKKIKNQWRLLNDSVKISLFDLTGQIYLCVAQMLRLLAAPSYIGMNVTVASGSNEQSYLRIWKPPKSKLGKEIIFV